MFSSHFPTKPQFPELVFTLNLWGVPKQQPRPSVLIFPYHYQRDILFSWETDINQGKKVNTTNFWKGSERVAPRPMSSLRTYSLQTFTGNWVSVRPLAMDFKLFAEMYLFATSTGGHGLICQGRQNSICPGRDTHTRGGEEK